MWLSLIGFIICVITFIVSKVVYGIIITSNIYDESINISKKADAIYTVSKVFVYLSIISFVIFLFLLTDKFLLDQWKQ